MPPKKGNKKNKLDDDEEPELSEEDISDKDITDETTDKKANEEKDKTDDNYQVDDEDYNSDNPDNDNLEIDNEDVVFKEEDYEEVEDEVKEEEAEDDNEEEVVEEEEETELEREIEDEPDRDDDVVDAGDGDDDDCVYGSVSRIKGKKGKIEEDDILEGADEYDEDEKEEETKRIYVEKEDRITRPLLNKYERNRVIGIRINQLNMGAKPLIKNVKKYSALDIAEMELKNNMLPFIIHRELGRYVEVWELDELDK